MKKRVLSLALAICLCLAVLPSSAFAAEGEFTIEDGVLVKYTGFESNIVIPNSVTTIGESAFSGHTMLTNITIPNSVEAIGNRAFFNCVRLKDLTLPQSLTSIGNEAFYGCCSLTNMLIPDGVTSIGESAFSGCFRLTSMTLPDSLTTIGDGAFSTCGFSSVVLPKGITSIGASTFRGCEALYEIVIPRDVTTIGSGAFWGCMSLANITLPEKLTTIGSAAFFNCLWLKSIVIPDNVTTIGDSAFRFCRHLTDITIPNSVAEIGDEVFDGCEYLTIYGIPGSTAEIYATNIDVPFVDSEPKQDTQSEPVIASGIAYATSSPILVDGVKVDFQTYGLKDSNGNITNYVKLRDIASVVNGTAAQFEVVYDGSIGMETGKAYTSNGSEMQTPFSGDREYKINTAPVKVNGAVADMSAITLTDDSGGGFTYFKLRDVGKTLSFNVSWDSAAGSIVINTNEPYDDN